MTVPDHLFGIWCKDANANRGDWLREKDGTAILAFVGLRAAQRRARDEYGFATYSDARSHGWVEVVPLYGVGA